MLTLRSILAVLLIIGFFVMAIGLASLLIWIPLYSWFNLGVLYYKGAALCVFGALVILSTIWPQREIYLPPGPRLDEEKYLLLFQQIRACAEATNSPMPGAVFLVPEPNAWVSRRGGYLLHGGDLILGLGLPLLAVLTTSQLTSVLAHEFGHELGNDTLLGSWIYRTRLKLLRAAGEFSSFDGHWLVLFKYPFVIYGRLFVWITAAVSRRQELRADELSGKLVGGTTAISALKTIHAAGPAYRRFLDRDFGPLMSRGYRPPLMDGFRKYFRRLSPKKDLPDLLNEAKQTATPGEGDTHPPLDERIRNLKAFGDPSKVVEASSAADLVAWDASLEKDIIARMSSHTEARRAAPITWEELDTDQGCGRVFLSERKELYRAVAEGLRGITALQLPEFAKDPQALGRRLTRQKMFAQQYEHFAAASVGTALILFLHSRGWALRKQPGRPLCVSKGETALEADAILTNLHEGSLSAEDWARQCAATGISEIDLGRLDQSGA